MKKHNYFVKLAALALALVLTLSLTTAAGLWCARWGTGCRRHEQCWREWRGK